MKIVVCIKRVPDTESRIRVAGDGRSIDPAGIKFVMSPYDEFALETALRVKDAQGGGEVVAVTVGEATSAEQLRSALAMGADSAVLLKGQPTLDGLATARALAAELREQNADLVLLGMKAVDADQQQVGPMLAELLDMPCITVAASIAMEDGKVVAHREVEGGVEVMEAPTPAVVSITKGEYEPRYPSLKGIMAAKKKPLQEKDAELGESRIEVRELSMPPERPAGRIIGQGVDAVPDLVRALREEAKVL
ncbi:MAG TPA: electron transfer flavoprotein subunit beta/FixA family protein [Longimicrobiales bacterium]|nr:electron transfer flavoprotein subunit beta/FixA family protein [Longimicrobiales bacterium]